MDRQKEKIVKVTVSTGQGFPMAHSACQRIMGQREIASPCSPSASATTIKGFSPLWAQQPSHPATAQQKTFVAAAP